MSAKHHWSIVILILFVFMVVTCNSVFLTCADDDDGQSDGPVIENECSSGAVSFSGDYQCLPDGLEIPDEIEVRREQLGNVEDIEIEDYVKGVLFYEMGPSFPIEALKAQAVAIRSYAVNWKIMRSEPICDTTACQVYGEERDDATDAAVDETAGVVVIFEDRVAETVYHASSGGYTEDVEDVWGSAYASYLAGVLCMENAQCADDCEVCSEPDDGLCDLSETGCCWGRNGHGVGMSQRGAQAMAECGFDHHEILTHYYTDVIVAAPCV